MGQKNLRSKLHSVCPSLIVSCSYYMIPVRSPL